LSSVYLYAHSDVCQMLLSAKHYVFKEILNNWNKCRDVQYGVTRVMWFGKVTTYQVTPWPQRLFVLLTECTGTELNTRELYGDDKPIYYGLKCIFYHIFKNLSSKTTKTATPVCAIQCCIQTNAVDLVEFYGPLCSLFYWIYFTIQLRRALGS